MGIAEPDDEEMSVLIIHIGRWKPAHLKDRNTDVIRQYTNVHIFFNYLSLFIHDDAHWV